MLNPWNWISSLYFDFLAPFLGLRKKATILFVGLDDAGKTTLLFRLKENRMMQAPPTLLPHCEQLQYGKVTFTTYDIGGHKQGSNTELQWQIQTGARRVWQTYFPVADGIVFIIDSTDRERFSESSYELQELLRSEEIAEVPIVVLVNKIDLAEAAGEHEIISLFGLYGKTTGKVYRSREDLGDTRPLEVFPCSVLGRQGYGAALKWLSEYM